MMHKLPYDLDRYFIRTDDAIEVPLTELIPGSPHAVEHAHELMLAAFNGDYGRRYPITIEPHPQGGYKVLDGNSTLANAIESGWPAILAQVVPMNSEDI